MKKLCLAALAAALVLATLSGAGSASASTATLCFVDTNPCPAVSIVPVNTPVAADSACYNAACNAGTESERVVIGSNLLGLITCTGTGAEDTSGEASTVAGSVVNNAGGSAYIRITSMIIRNCTNGYASCALTTVIPSGGGIMWIFDRPQPTVGGVTWSWPTNTYVQASCGGTTCNYTPRGTRVYTPTLPGAPDTRSGVDDASQMQLAISRNGVDTTCGDSPVISINYALHQDNAAKTNLYLEQ